MAEATRWDRESVEFGRALTFFDAIFAFSVTLLITTVDDFRPSAWTSVAELWHANGSGLAAFAISFIVVLSFWRANHRMFSGFVALDRVILLLTCAAMFWVVLIPFTTEAMGDSLLSQLPLPVAVYAVNITVAYLAHYSVYLMADRRRLLGDPMTDRERQALLIKCVPLPVVFLGSIPLAYLVSASVAQASWILVWPVIAIIEPKVDRWAAADPAAR